MKRMREAVIVSACRTPLAAFNGALSTIGATKLGGLAIEEAPLPQFRCRIISLPRPLPPPFNVQV